MTSHILVQQLDGNHPATMSRTVLHDLLREELGFSGVIVSDALDMAGASGSLGMTEAAVAALRAGCDLLCLGTENSDAQLADIERAVSSAVAEGTLAPTGVREATSRVHGLGQDLKAAAGSRAPPGSAPVWPKSDAELLHTWMSNLEQRIGGEAAGRYTVVRLEADPNIAVGTIHGDRSPSADPTAGAACAASGVPDLTRAMALPPLQPTNLYSLLGATFTSIGLGEVVDRLRSDRVDVLVVDMGWPSADRRYADVATFGASLLMGRVLLKWLARRRCCGIDLGVADAAQARPCPGSVLTVCMSNLWTAKSTCT